MKIAVLSGKGGTGKTTVSTNLAVNMKDTMLIDTDVEEPNAHIFMDASCEEIIPVYKEYPLIDSGKCILCGACGEFCRYNSIIPAKNTVLVFKESCHDCGGCSLVCKAEAIKYNKRVIGKIYRYESKYGTDFVYGDLNVGEMSGVQIIKELKEMDFNSSNVIIDCPPGTSCAAVEAAEGADYAVLVSEATPFGLSDMKMLIEMLNEMEIPFGVVINKAGLGNSELYEYCEVNGVEILDEIPFDREIAEAYSKGEIFSLNIDKYKGRFEKLIEKIISKESVSIEN